MAVLEVPEELNLAALHEALADALGDRECLVWRDRRLSWTDVEDRTRRVAGLLRGAGLGLRADPTSVAPWESPHDQVALYLHNGNEYLEAMVGAYKARTAPVNVNYRYVAEELRYVLADSRAAAVVYHGAFAPTLAAIERGGFTETEQVGEATYAKKITPAEARIDWTRPAAEVDAHIRGLSPFPGAWFEVEADGEPVRIKALMSALADGQGSPGQVLDDALSVACGSGAVRLTRVQRPGKAAQSAEEMLRGFAVPAGTVLDGPRRIEKAEPSDRGPQE